MGSKIRKAKISTNEYQFWYSSNLRIRYSCYTGDADMYTKNDDWLGVRNIRADGAAIINSLCEMSTDYINEAENWESFGSNEIVKDIHRLVQTILIAHTQDTISVSRASRT